MNVRIGGIDYEVVEVQDLRDGDKKLDGWIKYSDCQILIDDKLSKQIKRQVLWHEIFHGIFTQMGGFPEKVNDEFLCELLSYAILGILRDNPWLGTL